MASYTVFTRLIAKDEESRDKILQLLKDSVDEVKGDPEVVMFGICAPNEDQGGLFSGKVDPLTILNIEGYTTESTKQRLSEAPVGRKLRSSIPDLITSSSHQNLKTSISFTRKTLGETENPFIVLAKFEYQPGTIGQALEGWKELLDYGEKEEQPTVAYYCYEDSNDLRTLEIYTNKEFVYEVHAKSDAIKKNGAQNGKWRTGNNSAEKYHKIAGFLANFIGIMPHALENFVST